MEHEIDTKKEYDLAYKAYYAGNAEEAKYHAKLGNNEWVISLVSRLTNPQYVKEVQELLERADKNDPFAFNELPRYYYSGLGVVQNREYCNILYDKSKSLCVAEVENIKNEIDLADVDKLTSYLERLRELKKLKYNEENIVEISAQICEKLILSGDYSKWANLTKTVKELTPKFRAKYEDETEEEYTIEFNNWLKKMLLDYYNEAKNGSIVALAKAKNMLYTSLPEELFMPIIEMLIDKGDEDSRILLGYFYYDNNQFTKAFSQFKSLMYLNDPDVYRQLTIMCYFGEGTDINLDDALKYAQLIDKENDGYDFLGDMVELCEDALNEDFRKNVTSAQNDLCKQSNLNAILYLAKSYEFGKGVPGNIDKAAYYYMEAAKQNDIYSIAWLGDYYHNNCKQNLYHWVIMDNSYITDEWKQASANDKLIKAYSNAENDLDKACEYYIKLLDTDIEEDIKRWIRYNCLGIRDDNDINNGWFDDSENEYDSENDYEYENDYDYDCENDYGYENDYDCENDYGYEDDYDYGTHDIIDSDKL